MSNLAAAVPSGGWEMTRASISTLAQAGSLTAIRWAAPILLASAGSAAADPVFSIDASLSGPDGAQFVIGSDIAPPPPPKPYQSSRTDNVGIPGATLTLTYGVAGGQQFLGSLSSAAAKAPGAEISGQVAASLGVELDNLTISDPGVASGTPIFYDINFEIGGKIVIAAFGSADADASVSLSYNDSALGSAQADTNGGESTASGIFSAGISDVTAHTPPQSGVVGGPVSADFILVTSASVSAGPSAFGVREGEASASADFLDPLSFPSDGPIFNFFDANGNPLTGATVNSSDGCIVNNMFMCASVGPTGSVPELSTWAMMIAGFAGLGLAGLRRGRRRPAVPTGEETGYDQF
jgi:hypothetical protein